MDNMTNELVSLAATIAVSVLTLISFQIKAYVRDKTGREIQERDVIMMHSALKTGAQLALELVRRGDISDELAELRAIAIAYAKRSVPEALQRLNPDVSVLQDLATAKISEESSKAAGAVTQKIETVIAPLPDSVLETVKGLEGLLKR